MARDLTGLTLALVSFPGEPARVRWQSFANKMRLLVSMGLLLPAAMACGQDQVTVSLDGSLVDEFRQGSQGAPGRALNTVGLQGAASPSIDFDTDAENMDPRDRAFLDNYRRGITRTFRDDISTFSLGVRTGAFTRVVHGVRGGAAPDPAEVQTEDWLNAIDYQYDLPRDEHGIGVGMRLIEHPIEPDLHMLRVGFQAPDLDLAAVQSLNVTLLMESSPTMEVGRRAEMAQLVANALQLSMYAGDRMSVAHVGAEVLREHTVEAQIPYAEDVTRSLAQIQPHSPMNLQLALDEGLRLAAAMRAQRPDALDVVILLTDGLRGGPQEQAIYVDYGYSEYHPDPVRLIIVGLDTPPRSADYLIERLSQMSGGWYRYLGDPTEVEDLFRRETWVALSVPFARGARAQMNWDGATIQGWRLLGYDGNPVPDDTFADDRWRLSNMTYGAETTVYYEVVLTEMARVQASDHGGVELGRLSLRWFGQDDQTEWGQETLVTTTIDPPAAELDRALLDFGAIVALASDRYGSLLKDEQVVAAGVHGDLLGLRDHLGTLSPMLGGYDRYQDFRLVLDSMLEEAAARAS